MPKGNAVFLDTSIQIARTVHSPEQKRRIEERIGRYGFTVTGEVVRQEFKRRLLKEASYLLGKLNDFGSFDELYHHVAHLPIQYKKQQRKKNICLEMMPEVFGRATDAERTERFRLYLHYLLTLGLEDLFDDRVGSIVRDSGCACARMPIKEKVPLKRYEIPPEKCSRTLAGTCGIVEFLRRRAPEMGCILDRLRGLPADRKTTELQKTEEFLAQVLENPALAPTLDPCLTVGDLIISLESVGIPVFFTLNGKESQHFCHVLKQDLIVRRRPSEDDIECLTSATNWPEF